MAIQVRIFPALAALHNYIRIHDSEEINDFPAEIQDPMPSSALGSLAVGAPSAAEKDHAKDRWDQIAEEMWRQYQAYRQQREVGEIIE